MEEVQGDSERAEGALGWGHEGCGQTDGTEKRQETKRTRETREKRRGKRGARGKK